MPSSSSRSGNHTRTRLVRRAVLMPPLIAAGAAAFVWLPPLAPVRERFEATDARWVVAALALQGLSALSFVAAFRGAFERRIGWRAAFDLAAVEQGANILLPSGGSGGLVLGAALLVRAGVPTRFAARRTAVLFLVTSAASFAAIALAGVGVALGVLPGHAPIVATLVPAAAAALVMAAAAQLPRRLPLIRPGRSRIRRASRATQLLLREAVATSLSMIRNGDALLVGGSIGYLVFDVASLAAAFHALGHVAPPLGTFVLAYVLGHAGAIVPLPGSAEGGLVGMLAAYGSPLSLAVGAVLIYRTFHAGLPLALGAAGYADIRWLRRTRKTARPSDRRLRGEPSTRPAHATDACTPG